MSTPKIGDKVVYVPHLEDQAQSRIGAWRQRQVVPALVIEGPFEDGYFHCHSPGEDSSWNPWSAPAERLRVVERATYEPVEEVEDVRH